MARLSIRGLCKVDRAFAAHARPLAGAYPVLCEGDCPPWLAPRATLLRLVGMFAAVVEAEELLQLDRAPGVRRIFYDRPMAAALDRAKAAIGIAAGLDLTVRGQGVGVAVLDSGCAPHPDLVPALAGFVDLVGGEADPYDDFGHGTHLAGIIAGRGVVDPRLAGIAPGAHILPIKVLNEEGVGRESTIIRGLEEAVRRTREAGLRIVNLSLGGHAAVGGDGDPLCRAVEEVWRAGLVVVATAGNEGRAGHGTVRSPGVSPVVITVGAVTRGLRVARFSSRGEPGVRVKPDLVAPGTGIVAPRAAGSTLDLHSPRHREGDAYFRQSGSSVATAMVSGALALLLEAAPDLTPDEVKERLLHSAVDLGLPSHVQGAGLLSVPGLLAPSSVRRGEVLGRRVLRVGDRGRDVWYAQNRLNLLLGGVVGPATGLYDARTAVAVARFQTTSGLSVTGILDLETGRRLEATGALGRRVLRPGDGGADVRELRRRLGLAADGAFDAETEARVAELQRAAQVPVCGRADRHTYWALGGRGAALPLPRQIPYADR